MKEPPITEPEWEEDEPVAEDDDWDDGWRPEDEDRVFPLWTHPMY